MNGMVEVVAEELSQFKHYVRFVSRDPAKNRERFYLLTWQSTLHSDKALVCTWGRLGTLGRSLVVFFAADTPVESRLERLIRRRLRRGYQVHEWS